MLREETKGCSVPRAWGTTVLCGVVGGIFAVPAVFLQGKQSFFTLLMLVIVGPFIEESVKQSGMIYQMEKRPASICHDGQFFLAAVLGGLTFSILENLLYKHVYLANLPPDELTEIMKFRWMECTLMHIAAPLVSAFGLRNVWKESRAEGRPCKVERAFPWFVGAMCLHGLYNFLALLFQNWLFK
jgi:RsiW-degrading membrane proteinase PrsW (M82 family)